VAGQNLHHPGLAVPEEVVVTIFEGFVKFHESAVNQLRQLTASVIDQRSFQEIEHWKDCVETDIDPA
jgi:hypothetical protein